MIFAQKHKIQFWKIHLQSCQPCLMYSGATNESQTFTVNQIWLTGLQINPEDEISCDLACLHTFKEGGGCSECKRL